MLARGAEGVAQPPWQLLGARTLQIAAVKISLPFGHIPLLPVSVFSLPPVSKTRQITSLMNRADTIPVIAERCILLPELFDQGPRKCLFEKGGRGMCEWEPTTLHALKHCEDTLNLKTDESLSASGQITAVLSIFSQSALQGHSLHTPLVHRHFPPRENFLIRSFSDGADSFSPLSEGTGEGRGVCVT